MRGAVLAAALLLAAGCGGDDEATLRVSVHRDRLLEAQRAFELRFVNTGTDDREVTGATLVSELFEAAEPEDRVVTVRPTGDPLSMPLPYGTARCDADDPDGALSVRLDVDGVATEVDVGDAESGILRVHAAECTAQEVAEAADLGFGASWDPVGPASVAGRLEVEPRAGDVSVVEVEASVVFAVEVVSALPASGDVELVITAARCDAHALTESKKTYVFPVWVRIGDGERVRIEVVASEGPARAALDGAITECVAAR